ncbi:hypothetical protein R3P38DRAFT_688149 [Favolaschia claudopus]|uniref:F-box domain-containing protein n=1 Tax=Favolaschia claudopus TaxID=2862362 RepID=A0AAW0EAD1_9AGAR
MSKHAALRAEIIHLSSAILQQKQLLVEMQNNLQTLREQLESAVYPVLTLPAEITSEIFGHCMPGTNFQNVMKVMEAPTLFTHVCRAWRQVAICTPMLWTRIEVSALHSWPAAKAWVERARNLPLHLRVRGLVDDFALADILRPHHGHIRRLELHIDINGLQTLSSLGHCMVQQLHILTPTEPRWSNEAGLDRIKLFDSAPLLQSVYMHGAAPSWVVLPWQQLFRFEASYNTLAECMTILRLMSSLSECTLWVQFAGEEPNLGFLSHPQLQHLTLKSWKVDEDAGADLLLRHLTLPALQSLTIRDAASSLDKNAFHAFLQRSAPPLKTLLLYPQVRGNQSGLDLVLSPPLTLLEITVLTLSNPSLGFLTAFFESLRRRSDFFPELQELTLVCRRLTQDREIPSASEIVSMAGTSITSRADLVGCARLLSFRVIANESRSFYKESIFGFGPMLLFNKLKASGMEIHLGTEASSVM